MSYFKRVFAKLKRVSIFKSILVLLGKQDILFWSFHIDTKYNFGDAINPFIFKSLTGRNPVNKTCVLNPLNRSTYFLIGSILNDLNCKNAIICGSGFISYDGEIKKKPKKILGVRGPLSRDIFLKNNIDCPEIYCDPALLLPFFIKVDNKLKKYDFGIIPHYSDKKIVNDIEIISDSHSYKIIDIETDMYEVINNICSCKRILSSSLHGIIVSHAYGIPAAWLKLSNNLTGNDFKFKDYALSVNNEVLEPIIISKTLNLEYTKEMTKIYNVKKNQLNFLISLKNYKKLSLIGLDVE